MDGSRPGGQGPVGFTVWMTGLPGSGKSTLARLLEARLREAHGRYVEVLDGDEVRRGLSRDLGLSKEHREEHARRVSYVAKVLSRNGVVAVVALISPYRSSRVEAEEMIGPDRFVEVFVSAPLAVCEERDPKGLYAKARRGEITNMTGVQAPYEAPERPDLVVDTTRGTPEQSVDELISGLERLGKL
ncbi:MAG: adenylyl-sulfate kinase [Nitrososphaerota archaeon]|nr:adenylyl-sulfate kinase [Nitrososphaerota archaeon]MDG6976977.1 adenylyl-sulfate kinase [Nitrososphaerota archaeon]MDG7014979.1 adenylyl-sulfate kinase [Nitrososphaerota archaeon]WGO50935.1 MAG: adenylyl-sulfate kinase [Nitrososphaerota archaeon]